MGWETHLFRTLEVLMGSGYVVGLEFILSLVLAPQFYFRRHCTSSLKVCVCRGEVEGLSVLASCFQELAYQHFHFLCHRNWFRHGQRSQDDPVSQFRHGQRNQDDQVRLNLVGFGIIFGREIGFLSAGTNV